MNLIESPNISYLTPSTIQTASGLSYCSPSASCGGSLSLAKAPGFVAAWVSLAGERFC